MPDPNPTRGANDPADPDYDPVSRDRDRGAGEADDGTLLAESPAIAPEEGSHTGAPTASGGYGAASDREGWGDGTEDTELAGQPTETDWLRGAAGGGSDDRGA